MNKKRSIFQPFLSGGRGDKRAPDRNDRLIPMINVVFLLLTFFMVAGTIRATDAFSIKPPQAETEAPQAPNGWVLAVNEAGATALNEEEMPLSEAIASLKKAIQKTPGLHLQLKADGAVKADIILPLFKKLSDIGVQHLDIIVVRKRGA